MTNPYQSPRYVPERSAPTPSQRIWEVLAVVWLMFSLLALAVVLPQGWALAIAHYEGLDEANTIVLVVVVTLAQGLAIIVGAQLLCS